MSKIVVDPEVDDALGREVLVEPRELKERLDIEENQECGTVQPES